MSPHTMTHERREMLKQHQLQRVKHPGLGPVVERNIEMAVELRKEFERGKSAQDRAADRMTAIVGSMPFLYLNVVIFAVWIAANLGWLRVAPFDPFPFGLLTMALSIEAILLSVFVLVSQNRMQLLADQRAELDLQINLLSEYEITRVLKLVDRIAARMGIEDGRDPELGELEQDVAPEEISATMKERMADET